LRANSKANWFRFFGIAIAFLLAFSFASVFPVRTAVASAPLPTTDALPGFKSAGDLPEGTPVLVNIAIPLRNTGLLTSLVKQVSDPSSPLFRHFLTQIQIQRLFEPTAAFGAMVQYVRASGLKVDQTELNSVIIAEGTAGQVQQAFGTSLKLFTNGTLSYYMMTSGSAFDGASIYASNVTGLLARPSTATAASAGTEVTTFAEASYNAKVLQSVYNATALYKDGFDGKGQTIGILDFYGSPTIASDLAAYNQEFGFPTSNFKITAIGPYDPNIGIFTGWSTEVALDVETSHSMAPGADVNLYIADGALSLQSAIAAIVQDDVATSLTQSFGFPEWYYSLFGPAIMVPNGVGVDFYYQLGALEGITFSSSTGDTGGSGASSGPLGALEYPSTSPYVTSLGGTQTYAYNQSGKIVFTQTAWSNIGFVPDFVNEGGGTGGVSILEPRPWFQSNVAVPASYPNGRTNPDLALQAGVDPATFIVSAGSVIGEGGTSESTPLFAGLMALVASADGGKLGLVTPSLYQMAANAATYSRVFEPVTFGYIVPWTASSGYNLVTGWGALNAGEFAAVWKAQQATPGLTIDVTLSGAVDTSGLEYTPGTVMQISATVNSSDLAVTSGRFTATLETLQSASAATTDLVYNTTANAWSGSIKMGDESGPAFLNVGGSSGGMSGQGFAELFAGYLGEDGLFPTTPYTTLGGLPVLYAASDLDGNPAPDTSVSMTVEHYSILANAYSNVGTVTLDEVSAGVYSSTLTAPYPSGPTDLVNSGDVYGYLPMVMGIYLQNSYIYPEVVAEPGSVAPGQSLTVVTTPLAPVNVAGLLSFETGSTFGSDISVGSNVSASLVNPQGQVVSSASLVNQPCTASVRVCQGASSINGILPVPSSAPSGLYTILLTANYSSYTLGAELNGSFFSQVWVSPSALTPKVSLSQSTLYQGQTVQVSAAITYPGGQPVTQGEYSAFVFPQALASDFSLYMHTVYAAGDLTQLSYSPATSAWVGNVTLPSASNAGVLSDINSNAFSYSGPYSIMVTGLSSDGYPTTADGSTAQPFFIQPYTLVQNQVLNSGMQTSGLALSGVTINAPASLSNDIFLGTDTIQGGSVAITDSSIQGALNVQDAQLSLVGVSGGAISASNSQLSISDSSLGSLSLSGSTVTLSSSSYQSVTPPVPTIQISLPPSSSAYTGVLNVTVSITGQQFSSASISLDGSVYRAVPSGSATYTFPLDTATLSDGVHTLAVTATQQDGLSTSTATSFSTGSQITSAQNYIGDLRSTVGSQNTTVSNLMSALNGANAQISSQASKLTDQSNSLNSLTYGLYALGIIAIIALALAVVAMRRKEPPIPTASPPAPATQTP